MAQYSNLKAYIEEKIYENGTQAITGDILQDVLKVMTDDLGEFYQTGGVASPSTDPGTPDAKVIYFATEAGTYTNFGGITLAAGEVALLIFETSWTKVELNVLSSANGGVKTANLADGAVTTEKIAGGAVETAKIANNAVTSGKVADGAIGTAKIADGAIAADKIAANAVESAKIKNGAVTEGKINDGAVTADKVAANAVTTAKIADDAVTTAKLNDGAVTEDKIATDAVTSGKVKDGAIGTAKIAAGAVTHAKIGAGAVEESNIKDGAVTSDKIANGAVGSDQLAEGAFSAENLADGSVTTDKLADDAVTAEKIADGAVTADKFANGSVTTIKLGSGAVTTEKIGDGMVTRQKLADSSVGTSKIIDGAVTTDKVADGAITDAKLENPVSVSQKTITLEEWQPNTDYVVGNQRQNDGHYYRCSTAHTSGETFNASDGWTEITDFDLGGTSFQTINIGSENTPIYQSCIKIVGMGSTGSLAPNIGDIYYHRVYHLLRKRVSQSVSPIFVTVPFIDGAIYTYNNQLYVWDGANLIQKTFDVDNEPTEGSNNLVKSGGIRNEITKIDSTKLDKVVGTNLVNPDALKNAKYIKPDGTLGNADSNSFAVTDYIPIKGNNIMMYAVQANVSNIRPWVAYDENLEITRVGASPSETTTKYEYDVVNYPNDKYIRIGFSLAGLSNRRANYGDTLADYEQFTAYSPVDKLQQEVDGLQQEFDVIDNSLKKYEATTEVTGKTNIPQSYINDSSQIKNAGSASYSVNYYSVTKGEHYLIRPNADLDTEATAIKMALFTTSLPAIDVSGVLIFDYGRTLDSDFKYLFSPSENGYVCLYSRNKQGSLILFNTVVVSKITDLENRTEDLENRVEEIENVISTSDVELVYAPHKLYRVWNDIDVTRQNLLKIGLSRMLALNANKNQNVKFNNGLKFIPIEPISASAIEETTLNIISGESSKQCTIVNTPASLSVNVKPRVLVIGDSVTSGYGASKNKSVDWHPNQYWAFAKMLFEMDKIDNGDSGHDILFVGGFISNGTFTIQYKGVNRSVRVKAEGKGGAALQELFNPTWGDSGGTTNPFYDEVNQTFSIQAYLDNYRTMDDLGVRLVSNSADPHGESVVGSDGLTYTIGQKVTDQTKLATYDVCTPTHILMNLNHNTSVSNFEANIANVVNIIKTELPNVVFAWLCIDSTGTNFPADYPDFAQSMLNMANYHTKNNGFYSYFHDNIEDESNDIYLLGMNFIQPEAIDHSFTEIEQNGGFGSNYKIPNNSVLAPTAHPNNIAHAVWGYSLYAFIKWLISKDL